MSSTNANVLQIIDHDALTAVRGGDFWSWLKDAFNQKSKLNMIFWIDYRPDWGSRCLPHRSGCAVI